MWPNWVPLLDSFYKANESENSVSWNFVWKIWPSYLMAYPTLTLFFSRDPFDKSMLRDCTAYSQTLPMWRSAFPFKSPPHHLGRSSWHIEQFRSPYKWTPLFTHIPGHSIATELELLIYICISIIVRIWWCSFLIYASPSLNQTEQASKLLPQGKS